MYLRWPLLETGLESQPNFSFPGGPCRQPESRLSKSATCSLQATSALIRKATEHLVWLSACGWPQTYGLVTRTDGMWGGARDRQCSEPAALQDKGQMLGVNSSFSPSVLLRSAVPDVILGHDQEFNSKR